MIKLKTILAVFKKSLLFLLKEIVNDDSKNNNLNSNEEIMEEIDPERTEPHNLNSKDENSTDLDNNSTKSAVKSKYFVIFFLINNNLVVQNPAKTCSLKNLTKKTRKTCNF